MENLKKWIALSAILVMTISFSGLALAQTENDANGELEEVIVTAQKKEQNLREVTASVATLSDEKLDVITSGGQDIRMLSSRVPSLHIESSFGRSLPRFYIRGLGNTDFDLNASQPVSLVYDGVVLENPMLKGFPVFDMERIEVLRGPQGTLFGRNTPAGIVKFESRKPTFENEGYVRLSYAEYSTMQFETAASGAVTDNIAVRTSFLVQNRHDWVTNTHTSPENFTSDSGQQYTHDEGETLGGYNDFAGRLQFLLTPGDKFTALVNLHMRELDGTARLFHANLVESGSNQIVDGFNRNEIAVNGWNEQILKEQGGVLTMDYDMGDLKLTSITGYESGEIYSRGDIDGGTSDMDGIPFQSESAGEVPDLEQITEEIRLSSNYDGKLNFQTGIFYFDEDLKINNYNYITNADGMTPGPRSGLGVQAQQTKAWALFGTLDYQLTDAFKATGGIRYSDETKDYQTSRIEGAFGGPTIDEIAMTRESDFVSWDVSGLYTVNPDVNIYGRVAKGFRAPSFQGRLVFGDVVTVGETEEILSFELGTKTNLGRTARANLSVYSFTMNDQQLTAVGGEANFNQMLNADETAGMGMELELEWLPTSNVFMTVGTSYNKTEIKDPTLGVTPGGAAGLTVLDPELEGHAGSVSIDGNSLPNAPEWVFNATLRAATPMGDNGEIFLYTDWAYRSEVNFFLYESVEFMEDSMLEGGLRIGYTTYDRAWEFAGFARNITDTVYRQGGIDFNNLTGFVNEPRTFGAEIRRAF